MYNYRSAISNGCTVCLYSTKSTKFQLTSWLLVTDHCHLRAASVPWRRINCFSSADGKIHLTFHQVKSLGKITWAQLLKCDWRVESKYFKTKNRYFWQQFGENVFCITYEEVAIISAATDVNKSTPLSLSQCGHVSLANSSVWCLDEKNKKRFCRANRLSFRHKLHCLLCLIIMNPLGIPFADLSFVLFWRFLFIICSRVTSYRSVPLVTWRLTCWRFSHRFRQSFLN